jgi:hypothetical protein
MSQLESLEIAMKLEVSFIGENGVGMAQVQSQSVVLTIQLQDIVKGKEKRKEVWCTTCRIEENHKNECPYFQ